ncbi:MAG TPA: NADPH-dependent F420 reductase [Aggregatilinea sp.]|nr:NADPH-dependent F420 reductase [Aggregatilinea sp.]HML21193.1 NADPH-dependent F420 reductase [Aggregatilinea sp.]
MVSESSTMMTVAVLGGTGKEGSGLALRWAQAGYRVIIGSREAAKAQGKADEMNATLGAEIVTGLGNADAAAAADVVVLTVPYSAHMATLETVKNAVQGKIVVDVTVPLQPPNVRTVYVPEEKAAALATQAFLGEGVRVVAAFENISASHLKKIDHSIDSDVLVCGDDDDAKEQVFCLVESASMRGIDAGPLANAVAVEAMTAVLLYINKRYKVPGAGIRITGIE